MHKMIEKHKHKKQRVLLESDEIDNHIRKLPNSILSNILCSLKIREAVKTCVLSSEWRNLWTNRTDVVLDAENILEGQQHHSITNVCCCHLSNVHRFMIKKNRTYAFVDSVKSYLSCLSGSNHRIEKLKVCFTICRYGYGCNDLDDWISFAIDRNVEEIDLCLLEENYQNQNQLGAAPYDGGALYVFPCDIVGKESEVTEKNESKSFLKCLKLAHCVLAPHKSYSYGFTTLTTMELMKVDLVSGEHMLNLLASCNNLEWLSISECYNMDCLKIEHSFCQKLKYLNVNLCYQLKAIVIKSFNLETLEYKGSIIDICFDAPSLITVFSHVSASTACHSEIWPVSRLPIYLPHLETLFMECSCYMGGAMRNRLPTFPNLRHLIVIKVAIFRQDLLWIASALKACPKLERLELHLRTYLHIDEEIRKTNWPLTCPHNHLKEVAITGIRGLSSEIEIAIYLLKNASALEKMIIDPRPRIYLGNGKWGLSQACENWSRVGRKKVYENLMQQVCTTVKLLIL